MARQTRQTSDIEDGVHGEGLGVMGDKPRVRFLTVIWGERYIEEFLRVGLPSFLAPKNLPFLAQTTDLEVLIMTSTTSPQIFCRGQAFKALKAVCKVRFIFIDDLITTGNYGVTLTLAYARGVRDSGAQQTHTYFVFMNSDFVLADGALRTLAAKIAEGHPCIMAPSLRACSEAVLPELLSRVDPEANRLAVTAREMVQLALDNLHPTVIGKTITQDFVNCSTHNQIYWQVDSTTLLGRCHLMFMLAIKPERSMPLVNSYCDYGFVPELVPSGRFTVLDDSDDFFMLELQSAQQEKQFLACGGADIKKIARELSVWTTPEHRRFAEVDVVFHAGDLPANLQAVRTQAAEFISILHAMMTKRPVSHTGHFYWVMGLQSWFTLRRAEGRQFPEFPAECEVPPAWSEIGITVIGDPSKFAGAYLSILAYLRRLAGVPPNVPIWHYGWLDARLVFNWIDFIKQRQQQRSLLVCSQYSPLAEPLRRKGSFDIIHVRSLMSIEELSKWLNDTNGRSGYGNILCHVYRADVRQTRQILERLTVLLNRDAVVWVYIDHEGSDTDPSNFSVELAQYIHQLLPAGWTGLQVRGKFAGGLVRRRLRIMERRLVRFLWPLGWEKVLFLPFVVSLWTIVVGLTAMNNWWLRNGYSTCPPFCSSALLCLSPFNGATATDQSVVSPKDWSEIDLAEAGQRGQQS